MEICDLINETEEGYVKKELRIFLTRSHLTFLDTTNKLSTKVTSHFMEDAKHTKFNNVEKSVVYDFLLSQEKVFTRY